MEWLVLVTFLVTLFTGLLSGMSGGGGGVVVIPYFIAIGMPPASALATAKFGALGTSLGSLTAFKGKGMVDRRYIAPFMVITFLCALVSAWLIPQIDSKVFEKIIGVALLLMLPTLFINKAAFQPGSRTRAWVVVGFVAYTIFSFVQTLLGSGIGTMLVLVLMYLFGMDVLHATATKRVTQSVQAAVLFVLLAIQGLVVWAHGLAAIVGSAVGTHFGTYVALRGGTKFVKVMLAVVVFISGVSLLLA
jgi:uncharacterized membrane protein YfcA